MFCLNVYPALNYSRLVQWANTLLATRIQPPAFLFFDHHPRIQANAAYSFQVCFLEQIVDVRMKECMTHVMSPVKLVMLIAVFLFVPLIGLTRLPHGEVQVQFQMRPSLRALQELLRKAVTLRPRRLSFAIEPCHQYAQECCCFS